jgi:hypothetical protein
VAGLLEIPADLGRSSSSPSPGRTGPRGRYAPSPTGALHVGNVNAYVYWFLLGLVALWATAAGVLSF